MTVFNLRYAASPTLHYCEAVDGHPLPATHRYVDFTINQNHFVGLYMDGVLFTGGADTVQTTFALDYFYEAIIPNDGRPHTLQVRDLGDRGTPATNSNILTYSSTCQGVLMATVVDKVIHPLTNQVLVDVRWTHTGIESQAYAARMMIDGSQAGTEFTLQAGQTITRRVAVPADENMHVVKGQIRVGTTWATPPALWEPVQGLEPPPPGTPIPSEDSVLFVPGETLLIQSLDGSTPLATDGSEWVLMEISELGEDNWAPIGAPSGLIYPDEDGGWSATIETPAEDFPPATSWEVRTRRFRNFAPSNPITHSFTMLTPGSIPDVPSLVEPVILGPLNHNQWGGTWLELFGTGTPGAAVEFDVQRVSGWGDTRFVPLPTTVGKSGRWRTYVFGIQRSFPNRTSVLGYRVRSHLNGQYTDWSERLDVTWRHPRR